MKDGKILPCAADVTAIIALHIGMYKGEGARELHFTLKCTRRKKPENFSMDHDFPSLPALPIDVMVCKEVVPY